MDIHVFWQYFLIVPHTSEFFFYHKLHINFKQTKTFSLTL